MLSHTTAPSVLFGDAGENIVAAPIALVNG